VDVAALVAPRPLLIESGTEDDLFPAAVAAAEAAKLRTVYDSMGASDHLVHDVFAGVHEWHGTEAYPFLERWLSAAQADVG
jgi:hypothetical protein